MKRRLKLNGAVMFLATLVLASFPAFFFREDISGVKDSVAEIFGIAFILMGQLIRVSARGFKAESSDSGKALIQDGPYAFVRNPMYLGIFLIGLGAGLMLFKWWVAAFFIVFFIIRYIALIYSEEKKLKALFPLEYPIYSKKVPHRIIPSLDSLLNKDMHEYLPLKLKCVKKEIGSILAVLFLAILLESWEDIRSGGIAQYLKETVGIFAVMVLFAVMVWYLNWQTDLKNDTGKGQDNQQ